MFESLVEKLASNAPYTESITATQFLWLKNHGNEYYNKLPVGNLISYEDFEKKWQMLLEVQSYEKFKINFNYLIPENLAHLKNSSSGMLELHGTFTFDQNDKPIAFEMPEDIMRKMLNQLTLQDKINQLFQNTEISKG